MTRCAPPSACDPPVHLLPIALSHHVPILPIPTQLFFTEADLDSIHFDPTGEIVVEDHFVDMSSGTERRKRRAISDMTPSGFTGASKWLVWCQSYAPACRALCTLD